MNGFFSKKKIKSTHTGTVIAHAMRANRTLLRLHVLVDNIRAMVGTTGLRTAQFHPASRKGDGGNVLVVLIGWWLAKEKHLAKYLPIWHENGCATFSFVPNFFGSDLPRMAEAMMDNVAAYLEKEPDTIIIFHVFKQWGIVFDKVPRVLKKVQAARRGTQCHFWVYF